MSNPIVIDASASIQSFQYAAGMEALSLAKALYAIGTVLLLMWFLWSLWSAFKGRRRFQVTADDFRRVVFSGVFIFLVLTFFLMT